MIKKLTVALALIPALAFGQSSPNWPGGYRPSPQEMRAAFAGKLDIGAPFFGTFNGTVGATTPSTAAFTTTLVGTGTPASLPTQFQSAITFDPSAAGSSGSAYRRNMFNTTLNYAGNTVNVWEGVTSFTTISGPGQANGEINQFHSFTQYNANATVLGGEGYEDSFYNFGALTGNRDSYLSLLHNFSTGTAANMVGLDCQFINENPAPGAVTTRICLNFSAMGGGGSAPTFNLLIKNSDPTGVIDTAGPLAVGYIGVPTAGNLVEIHGIGTTSATYSLVDKNSAGANLFYVRDDGFIFLGAGASVNSSGLQVAGPDNSNLTFALTVKNLAGANLFSVSDSGVALIGSSVTANSVGLQINGTDNSPLTFPLVVKNLAGTVLLALANNGAITVGATVGVTCAGAPTGSFASTNGIVTHC